MSQPYASSPAAPQQRQRSKVKGGMRPLPLCVGSLVMFGVSLWFTFHMTESGLRDSHGRRSGTMRALLDMIGIDGVRVVFGLFALACLAAAIIGLRNVIREESGKS